MPSVTCQYDTSELSRRFSSLFGALFGGGASPGELQQALMTETGQLAGRMGDAAGPTTQSKGNKVVDRSVRDQLGVLPSHTNLDADQQESSYADFTWLYASPNALLGIADEDNLSRIGNEEALATFIEARKHERGLKYKELGKRGKQKVVQFNRIGVIRSQFNYVSRAMHDRVGQLRAAFYRIARRYVASKRVPAWVARHFETVEANGKSQLDESGLQGTASDFIQFTIASPGVVDNERLVAKFQGAIEASKASIQSKLRKIAKGAKYIFETGQVYFPKEDES